MLLRTTVAVVMAPPPPRALKVGRPNRRSVLSLLHVQWNQTEPADPYGGSNGRRGNDIPYAGAPSEVGAPLDPIHPHP